MATILPVTTARVRSHRHTNRRRSLRRTVYHALGGDGQSSALVTAVDWFLILLILGNVVAVILESVETLAVAHGPAFHGFDLVSVAIFSVEYLLRLWTAVELDDPRYHHPLWGRLRWIVSPMALIDLAAVLPFYMGVVVDFDLRSIRVLRVLRMFKLSRYSMAINVMAAVARQEARAIGATLVLMLIVVVMASSLMYLVEHRAQPEVFSDIPTAMWWAVVTLTTLGYGDMVPATTLGRALGGLTAVLGVGMVALPAGVMASGFSEQMRIRREEYREAVQKALEEGHISGKDRRMLEEARVRLGLSATEAVQILEQAEHHSCPHCGHPAPHPIFQDRAKGPKKPVG